MGGCSPPPRPALASITVASRHFAAHPRAEGPCRDGASPAVLSPVPSLATLTCPSKVFGGPWRSRALSGGVLGVFVGSLGVSGV